MNSVHTDRQGILESLHEAIQVFDVKDSAHGKRGQSRIEQSNLFRSIAGDFRQDLFKRLRSKDQLTFSPTAETVPVEGNCIGHSAVGVV